MPATKKNRSRRKETYAQRNARLERAERKRMLASRRRWMMKHGVYKNAGPLSKRKSKKFAKKALKRLGVKTPKKRRTSRSKQVKANPPKMRPLKSTGWMNASAVKIIRNRGKVQVLVRRKPKSRRR